MEYIVKEMPWNTSAIEFVLEGGPKMAKEYDGETTFSPTNSSKEHLNSE